MNKKLNTFLRVLTVVAASAAAVFAFLLKGKMDIALTNTAWAVVNHNSEYASIIVVPEPGALSLAGVGLALVCWTAARRRCRSAR